VRLLAKGKTTDETHQFDDAPSASEGLELLRAFRKITAADRQKVIELAKRLAADTL
jgi:hypothetical protein